MPLVYRLFSLRLVGANVGELTDPMLRVGIAMVFALPIVAVAALLVPGQPRCIRMCVMARVVLEVESPIALRIGLVPAADVAFPVVRAATVSAVPAARPFMLNRLPGLPELPMATAPLPGLMVARLN